jgi:hypothetical protein
MRTTTGDASKSRRVEVSVDSICRSSKVPQASAGVAEIRLKFHADFKGGFSFKTNQKMTNTVKLLILTI